MGDRPTITTFRWVPEGARGFVRDLRARWAFEEEGIDYAVELIDFAEAKAPAHRRVQPFGQVPTYRDGAVEIFESGAITLWIAEQGRVLLPADPAARIRSTQWVIAALNSVEQHVMNLAACDFLEADRPWSPMRRGKVVADLQTRLRDLEAALGGKTWLDGETFTVGDLTMVSVLGGLRNSDVLAGFPRLAAYVSRGESRPAHRKAMADQMALYADPPCSGDLLRTPSSVD
jgi:glutathione S-transferase